MDLRGNLGVFEPIFVFQILNLAMCTGELILEKKDNRASVYFDQGKLTFAEIADRPTRLGEYLVREGYISDDQLERALAKKTSKKKIGRVLMDEGVLDEKVLKHALEEQIKEVVYEVVKWRVGKFAFKQGRKPKALEISIDIPLDHLMLEGLKRLDESEGSP